MRRLKTKLYVSKSGLADIKYLMSNINLSDYALEERIIKMFRVDSLEELDIEQAELSLRYLEDIMKYN